MFNKPYTYNQNVTLVAGAQLLYQHKMLEDFYCFDIAGVDSVATGQNLRMRIRDVTEQREFMPEMMRSGLIAAIVSGDSSWYFPTLFKKGHVIEVECALGESREPLDPDRRPVLGHLLQIALVALVEVEVVDHPFGCRQAIGRCCGDTCDAGGVQRHGADKHESELV